MSTGLMSHIREVRQKKEQNTCLVLFGSRPDFDSCSDNNPLLALIARFRNRHRIVVLQDRSGCGAQSGAPICFLGVGEGLEQNMWPIPIPLTTDFVLFGSRPDFDSCSDNKPLPALNTRFRNRHRIVARLDRSGCGAQCGAPTYFCFGRGGS
jgi:hypothetical protein